MSTNIELRRRIKMLEEALMDAGLPFSEHACDCCKHKYIPRHSDSIRCNSCCTGCYYNREQRKWIQSEKFCPAMRNI